jgi:hypothetical protein
MGLYTRMGVSEYTVGLYTRGLYWGGGGGSNFRAKKYKEIITVKEWVYVIQNHADLHKLYFSD